MMDSEFLDGKIEIGRMSIPVIAGNLEDNPEECFKNLIETLKDETPLDRNRPYTCQQPKRNQFILNGLSRRDIKDCIIRGFLQCAHGVDQEELYQKVKNGTCCADDIYKLDFDEVDPLAAVQNACNEMEIMLGIYPNLVDGQLGV